MPSDPDTHQDFRPTNKLESGGVSLKDVVEQVNDKMNIFYYVCDLQCEVCVNLPSEI